MSAPASPSRLTCVLWEQRNVLNNLRFRVRIVLVFIYTHPLAITLVARNYTINGYNLVVYRIYCVNVLSLYACIYMIHMHMKYMYMKGNRSHTMGSSVRCVVKMKWGIGWKYSWLRRGLISDQSARSSSGCGLLFCLAPKWAIRNCFVSLKTCLKRKKISLFIFDYVN